MEAQRLKINILPPDVNYSEEYFTTYGTNCPFGVEFDNIVVPFLSRNL